MSSQKSERIKPYKCLAGGQNLKFYRAFFVKVTLKRLFTPICPEICKVFFTYTWFCPYICMVLLAQRKDLVKKNVPPTIWTSLKESPLNYLKDYNHKTQIPQFMNTPTSQIIIINKKIATFWNKSRKVHKKSQFDDLFLDIIWCIFRIKCEFFLDSWFVMKRMIVLRDQL